MNAENLRAAAARIVERIVREHPDVASVVAALVISEILALGLYGDSDEGAVEEFVQAVNGKLAEIATAYDRPAWQLVLAEPPQRH